LPDRSVAWLNVALFRRLERPEGAWLNMVALMVGRWTLAGPTDPEQPTLGIASGCRGIRLARAAILNIADEEADSDGDLATRFPRSLVALEEEQERPGTFPAPAVSTCLQGRSFPGSLKSG